MDQVGLVCIGGGVIFMNYDTTCNKRGSLRLYAFIAYENEFFVLFVLFIPNGFYFNVTRFCIGH